MMAMQLNWPVKSFQQERGITVDGLVGKITWLNIDEADQSEPVLG
jgi:peptidoglycan hydrolase-like protein with peptidoglycan-binding domain